MLATPYGNVKILFDGKESSFDMIRVPENQKVWPDVKEGTSLYYGQDKVSIGVEAEFCDPPVYEYEFGDRAVSGDKRAVLYIWCSVAAWS